MLLGNGDGTFLTKVDYSVGEFPVSLAIGDLNGDGKLDLAVANAGSAGISILLGNGDGTFQTKVDYGVDDSPLSVAISDLNGDGNFDFAVANAGSANVSVLFGAGDGTFATQVRYGAANGPSCVAIGDLNGDGEPDLAVANAHSSNISVRLGEGGAFPTKIDYDVAGTPAGVAIGDLNGDGVFDLAVANSGNANLAVLLGNGNGTFQTPTVFSAVDAAFIAIGDLNGDGKPDMAVADYGNSNVSVFLNTMASPMAVCEDVTVSADDECQANVAPEMVGYGSTTGVDCVPPTMRLSPPGPYALGDTAVTLTVTGQFGLTDTCSATVSVVDTTVPVLIAPADLECSNSTDVAATGVATATDRCDAAPRVTYSDVVDGSVTGMITRTWTATDASGNTASQLQIIRSIDTTPPVITCPVDIVRNDGPGPVTFAVSAIDDCDPDPRVTTDWASESLFGEGVTEVQVTARDASNNTSTCSFRVTVYPAEADAQRAAEADAQRSATLQLLGTYASLCGLGASFSLVGTTAGLCGMKLGMRRRQSAGSGERSRG